MAARPIVPLNGGKAGMFPLLNSFSAEMLSSMRKMEGQQAALLSVEIVKSVDDFEPRSGGG